MQKSVLPPGRSPDSLLPADPTLPHPGCAPSEGLVRPVMSLVLHVGRTGVVRTLVLMSDIVCITNTEKQFFVQSDVCSGLPLRTRLVSGAPVSGLG